MDGWSLRRKLCGSARGAQKGPGVGQWVKTVAVETRVPKPHAGCLAE